MRILSMLKDLYLSYFTTGLTYNIQHFSYTSQALSSLFSLFLIFEYPGVTWGTLRTLVVPWRTPGVTRGDLVDRELFMSYKYLTYLVERRNSPVKLPYIPYKPSYPIFPGTH
jgi:hypothetical protein